MTLVPLPCIAPENIYKYRRAQPLSGAKVVTYMTREVREVEGRGIFTYYHGIDIPRIGVSPTYQDFPKAMAEVDKVKRVLREYLKNPFLIFRPEKTLRSFNDFADKCLRQWYIDEKYWCPTTMQIYLFLLNVLEFLGIGTLVAMDFSTTVATLFEYDDAYRYRFNDLMSETTQERMIENFIGETARLLDLDFERENYKGVNDKFKNIHRLLRFACLIPKIKHGIIEGLKAVDWKGWQLTESEIFHTLVWDDYNVQGRNAEERQAYYDLIFAGKEKPKQIKITLK